MRLYAPGNRARARATVLGGVLVGRQRALEWCETDVCCTGCGTIAACASVALATNGRGTRPTSNDSPAAPSIMKLGRALGKIAVPTRGHIARILLTRCAREVALLRAEGASVASIDRTLSDFGFRREFLSELAAAPSENPTRSANSHRDISDTEIRERCLFSVINAAARALEDGLVARPLDIDMIAVHGLGFPIYRGGPMFFADVVGSSRVHASISRYREQLGEEEWSPAPLLERLARDGKPFYGKP